MVEKIDGKTVYTQVNADQLKNTQKQQEDLAKSIQAEREMLSKEVKPVEQRKPGELTEVIEEPIDAIKNMDVKRLYNIDDELNWTIVSVLHPETNELLRQIPPKVSVDIAKYLREYLGRNVNIEA